MVARVAAQADVAAVVAGSRHAWSARLGRRVDLLAVEGAGARARRAVAKAAAEAAQTGLGTLAGALHADGAVMVP